MYYEGIVLASVLVVGGWSLLFSKLRSSGEPMLAGTALQSSYSAAVNILRKAANAGSVKLGMEPVAADVPLQSALDHSR